MTKDPTQAYRDEFNKIAESGFDHHRKLAHQNFQESDLIVTDRIVAYPESYEVSEPVFVGEMPLRADTPEMKSLKAKAWTLAAEILEANTPRTDRDGVTPEVPMSEIVAHIRDHVVPSLRQRASIIERNHKVREP
jgi:hypothetical protein